MQNLIKKRKRPISLALVFALLLGLLGGSLAYFTDKIAESAEGTTGTVAIELTSRINFLDSEGRDIINPGDIRNASFDVTNKGNKSIDVRTTIALTTQSNSGQSLSFTGDGTTQSEYDLYLASDVELVEGKGYAPKAGATPLQVKSVDQDVITYILPEYSLNGNSDEHDEVETIEGVTAFTYTYDLVMIMKGEAGNKWQDSVVSMDVLVEAKQHENTDAGWEIVAKENIANGSINQSAVKGENVITDAGNVGDPGIGEPDPANPYSDVNLTFLYDDNSPIVGSTFSLLARDHGEDFSGTTDDTGLLNKTVTLVRHDTYTIQSDLSDVMFDDVVIDGTSSDIVVNAFRPTKAATITFLNEDGTPATAFPVLEGGTVQLKTRNNRLTFVATSEANVFEIDLENGIGEMSNPEFDVFGGTYEFVANFLSQEGYKLEQNTVVFSEANSDITITVVPMEKYNVTFNVDNQTGYGVYSNLVLYQGDDSQSKVIQSGFAPSVTYELYEGDYFVVCNSIQGEGGYKEFEVTPSKVAVNGDMTVNLVVTQKGVAPAETHTLDVTVVDSVGNPVPNAEVVVQGNGPMKTVMSDSNGVASFELEEGDYYMVGVWSINGSSVGDGEFPDVSFDLHSDKAITLRKSVTVNFHVQDTNGNPLDVTAESLRFTLANVNGTKNFYAPQNLVGTRFNTTGVSDLDLYNVYISPEYNNSAFTFSEDSFFSKIVSITPSVFNSSVTDYTVVIEPYEAHEVTFNITNNSSVANPEQFKLKGTPVSGNVNFEASILNTDSVTIKVLPGTYNLGVTVVDNGVWNNDYSIEIAEGGKQINVNGDMTVDVTISDPVYTTINFTGYTFNDYSYVTIYKNGAFFNSMPVVGNSLQLAGLEIGSTYKVEYSSFDWMTGQNKKVTGSVVYNGEDTLTMAVVSDGGVQVTFSDGSVIGQTLTISNGMINVYQGTVNSIPTTVSGLVSGNTYTWNIAGKSGMFTYYDGMSVHIDLSATMPPMM